MTHLTDVEITALLKGRIYPWEPANINPASLDLRLGNLWIDLNLPYEKQNAFQSDSVFLYPDNLETGLYNCVARSAIGRALHLQPRLTLILAVTLEYISLPADITAEVHLKTTPCRLGLGHPIAGWVDPGYCGNLTLMLHSYRKIRLAQGVRICQLVFGRLAHAARLPYGVKGHYQDNTGPARAWKHEL